MWSIVGMVTFSTASLWRKISGEIISPTHFIDFFAKIISKQLTSYRYGLVTKRGKLVSGIGGEYSAPGSLPRLKQERVQV